MKKIILLLACFCVCGISSYGADASQPSGRDRPNLVLILIDDMGYGDIEPFGSIMNRTPSLDRMASEGMKLTSFYAAPVCSVSRAQVLTGSYGTRVSIPGVLPPDSAVGLSPAEHTLAELLKTQGYATMCIGKWHLGDQPEFFPTRFGFDHYFGLPYSNDMFIPDADTGQSVVPLMRDNKVVELLSDADEDRLTRLYTEEAVKFIRDNREHPFFLYLPHTAVHFPIHPGPEFRGKSGHGRYSDWVEEMDWSTGRVLDTLRELHLATHTLVIFTSDNGPWLIHKEDAGTAGPLRGGKGSTWEGGLREPTLAWWPGHVPAGTVRDTIAGTIDLLPTLVTLAGGTVPTDHIIDGADISQLLLGHTKEPAREAHYYYLGYKLQAVRSGPWKLALSPQDFSMGIRQGGVSEPGLRLYNLDQDIGETTDVGAQHPEVVKRLKALADHMAATLCDGSDKCPGARPPGRVEHPQYLYSVKETPRNWWPCPDRWDWCRARNLVPW
jgi:arylsulfatase A